MDADWYVDPLGRFDGRFFDGELWTNQVSKGGSLLIDPDFPTADPTNAEWSSLDEPAVVPVGRGPGNQASRIEESPVRTVAVLDDDVRVPVQYTQRPSRWPVIWGLLAVIAALAVAALLFLDRGDSGPAAQNVDLDAEQEQRVEDLETGGQTDEMPVEDLEPLEVDAPIGVSDPTTVYPPEDAIDVGGLRVLNGVPALAEIEAWHLDFAADRRPLGAYTGCWFGQLGGAAVQVAHCGPVEGPTDAEFLFDSVPLVFVDADGGQIAQPVVEAVELDQVLPNALELRGTEEKPPPSGAN